MTITFIDEEIYLHGECLAAMRDAPVYWADLARGDVLEIGLGHGLLARAIEKHRPGVKRHVVIEQHLEIIDCFGPTLPPLVQIIHGVFPCEVDGLFDTIFIDTDGVSISSVESLLAIGGFIKCYSPGVN